MINHVWSLPYHHGRLLYRWPALTPRSRLFAFAPRWRVWGFNAREYWAAVTGRPGWDREDA
jgi:hypothetical protein